MAHCAGTPPRSTLLVRGNEVVALDPSLAADGAKGRRLEVGMVGNGHGGCGAVRVVPAQRDVLALANDLETECSEYCGIEWTNPPKPVRDGLATHSKYKAFAAVPPEDMAISIRMYTRTACRRICEAAFAYAKKHGYKTVTVCEKPNVLRETSGMMEEEARRVKENYPGIDLWSTNIDAQMMWLTKNPEDYGVLVAENLFGDIVSDAFAGLVGGLGFACSGNIGDEVAVFEPTHGSAPKYEQLDPPIVNPIAMILSAAMLLDHVGEIDKAERVRGAVATVVREGRVRTYDMMRLAGGPKSIANGAATSIQMTDAILAHLK